MEGVIQEMNKGALDMFGYTKDELIGIKRVSIFSEADIVIQNVLGWLDEANKKGKSIVKTRFKRKDGSLFNAEILITPNYANGKDKGQTGYCGITKEINKVRHYHTRKWTDGYMCLHPILPHTPSPLLAHARSFPQRCV